MAQRPQLAAVLVLALFLVSGLAAVLFWGGFGTGQGLSTTEPVAPSRGAGDTREDTGTLEADAGLAPARGAETDRQSIGAPALGASGISRVQLTGRLVRSDGTPGAGLTLRCLDFRAGAAPRGTDLSSIADAPAVKADPDGRFRVATDPDSMAYLYLDGTEAVFKAGTGRGMGVQMGRQAKDLGDVLILTPARVSGQVVDTGGVPVAGVSVTSGQGGGSVWAMIGEGRKTDKDGRFDLGGLQPGHHKLVTRSPDHLPAGQELDLAEGQHRQDILIQVLPGGFILGTVVDDLGQPVPDAEVAASRTEQLDTQVKITAFSPGESTRTDPAGRFRLANLNAKKATLRASKAGLDTQMVPDVIVGTTDLVVEMKRLGAVEGVVVDEENRPIQGSTVSTSTGPGILGIADLNDSGTVTNAAGEFRLENVRPGRIVVTARSDTHLPAQERVQVGPGETTRGVCLVASPGATLEVTVQDASGQPLADAAVTVRQKDSDGPWPLPARGGRAVGRRIEHRAIRRGRNGPPVFLGGGNTLAQGKTDARGKVALGGLPGGEVVVGARHEELALVAPQELVLPDRGRATALLRMRRGGFLLVSAVDAAGKPMPDARFTLAPTTSKDEDQQDTESREERMPRRGSTWRCDGDGKAKVGPLAAGEYRATLLGEQRPRMHAGMSFTLAGMQPSLHDSKVTLQVREGDTTEVVLRKPVLTTVKGNVRDRSGPVKGAQVALTREGEPHLPFGNDLEDRTDEEGRFEIVGVPSGSYTLSWGRPSAVVPSEDNIRLQKDQAELVRDLVIPGAVVKLRAVDPEDAEPVEGAEVFLVRMGAGAQGTGQQPRQRTQFRMISVTNRGSGPQRIDMSAGDRSAQTDENGVVVLKDVPQGKYQLSIRHRRFATHRENIEILIDATLDLGTKKLTCGGSVSGRILFDDADQMHVAVVQLTTLDGKDVERTVSTDGGFRFSGLPSGKYTARAQRIGKANAPWGPEETIEVRPGDTARTQLKLPPR